MRCLLNRDGMEGVEQQPPTPEGQYVYACSQKISERSVLRILGVGVVVFYILFCSARADKTHLIVF